MAQAARLRNELLDARARTRAVADDLGGEREFGPQLRIVNPPRWELGHIGWFHEYWCLRRIAPGRHSPERGASILQGADALYNSAAVPHDTRWTLPLPPFQATLGYRDEVLGRILERLDVDPGADSAYFAALATRHEDMHAEAFHYTRQTLAYPAPAIALPVPPAGKPVRGDAEIAGGPFELGSLDDGRWAFDNEKWAHPVKLRPFRMSRTAVSNAEFLAFVEADGYSRREFWSAEAWRALLAVPRRAPIYWRKAGEGWELRCFDRWAPMRPDEPVTHVSWHEAEAYCRFAGRRLPTEAEWEYAATWDPAAGKRRNPWGDATWEPGLANLAGVAPASVHAYPGGDSALGLRQMIGNCWEWTSSVFLPFPGFLRDPYKEYSEPWFGTHRVLRGGAYATSPRIAYATYRNFFTPERADIFAGLRTCALED